MDGYNQFLTFMTTPLDLKDLTFLLGSVAAIVGTYYDSIRRANDKVTKVHEVLTKQLADYKLESLEKFASKSDMEKKFDLLMAGLDKLHSEIGAVLEKLEGRVGLLEGRGDRRKN